MVVIGWISADVWIPRFSLSDVINAGDGCF